MASRTPFDSSLERALLTPAVELAVLWRGVGWFHVHNTRELAGVPSRRVASFRADDALVAALSVPPRERAHQDLRAEVLRFFEGEDHVIADVGPTHEAQDRAVAVLASLRAGERHEVPGLGHFATRRRRVLTDLQATLPPERRFDEIASISFRPDPTLRERLQRLLDD